MIKIIADSGSTKTDWCVTNGTDCLAMVKTEGINPFHQTEEAIEGIIRNQLIPQLGDFSAPDSIEFYGAGCTKEKCPVMAALLGRVFGGCGSITVDSDLLGAAKALCGNEEGIACILGTGANSCLYDGERIVQNVSPMGYIVGDEGSGAVIGKVFVGELYKGFHEDLIPVFEAETGLDKAMIIQKVYREPMANRFLASLSLFIAKHIDDQPWLGEMITECFRNFFRKNISHYNRPDLPVNFVGSIAYNYRQQLKAAADMEGFILGKVIKAPLYSVNS